MSIYLVEKGMIAEILFVLGLHLIDVILSGKIARSFLEHSLHWGKRKSFLFRKYTAMTFCHSWYFFISRRVNGSSTKIRRLVGSRY